MGTIVIVAGEASGDLHGAGLVRALRQRLPRHRLIGVGGDRMEQAGLTLLYHINQFAYMGFFEVFRHFPFIMRAFKRLDRLLDEVQPDLLILIDYPGFNLKLGRRARQKGLPVLYYISPQIWAWGGGRVAKIARAVDVMAVVFPFEVGLYDRVGVDTRFVGHPLLEHIGSRISKGRFCQAYKLDPDKPIMGLLPGSRRHEVARLLPPMVASFLQLREQMPGLQAVLGLAPTITRKWVEPYLKPAGETIRVVEGETYALMKHSEGLLVASGTATLEAACLGTPMVVLYKMSWLSWILARALVKIRHIALVNVMAGRCIVAEILQGEVRPERIVPEALVLLQDGRCRAELQREFSEIRQKLGGPGASRRVAEIAAEIIEQALTPAGSSGRTPATAPTPAGQSLNQESTTIRK